MDGDGERKARAGAGAQIYLIQIQTAIIVTLFSLTVWLTNVGKRWRPTTPNQTKQLKPKLPKAVMTHLIQLVTVTEETSKQNTLYKNKAP